MIIKNSHRMIDLMGNAPFFVMSHSEDDLQKLETFVHRTFNGQDFSSFIRSLKTFTKIMMDSKLFSLNIKNQHQFSISEFKKIFFEIPHQYRTKTRIRSHEWLLQNALICFLRWMCRQDSKGVDLGIWKSIPSSSILSFRRPFR
jgi:hypothetical protein